MLSIVNVLNLYAFGVETKWPSSSFEMVILGFRSLVLVIIIIMIIAVCTG